MIFKRGSIVRTIFSSSELYVIVRFYTKGNQAGIKLLEPGFYHSKIPMVVNYSSLILLDTILNDL